MSSHSHTETADSYQIETSRWTAGRNVLVFVVLVGVLASAAGYLTDPARFFQSYLVAFCYTTFIGLGAFFFVMVQFLTGSAWSVTTRRIMENIMATLPAGLILFVPVAFGLRYIYPWTDAAKVAAEGALKAKAVYLEPNAFLLRAVAYFAVWSIWVFALYRQSTKQDTERSVKQMHIASRWSAPGLFLAVAVGTLAAYDWLMSVEPSWFSTIFGLITLSGGALSFRDSGEHDHQGALSRSRKMAVRSDGVLHLRCVFAISVAVVFESAGRDAVVPAPDGGRMARGKPGDAIPAVYHSVLRAAVPSCETQLERDRVLRGVEFGGGVHRPLLGGDAGLLSERTATALAGSGDARNNGGRVRFGFLDAIEAAQDGAGGGSAIPAEPAF